MHKNRPGPTGWTLKSALAALPRLEIEPLFPAHGALLSSISVLNATADNFEIASTMYSALKTIHVSSVAISIGLFILRLFWSYTAPTRLQLRWVRILPHAIDTILLASAIGLTMLLEQYPFVHAWLTAKVLALVAYIVFGSFALKRARTAIGRNVASIVALSCVVYIIAVAISHDPYPFG